MSDLLPCPFCGSGEHYDGVTENGDIVCCNKCHATGPETLDTDHDSDDECRDAAEAAWNVRPQETAMRARLSTLEATLVRVSEERDELLGALEGTLSWLTSYPGGIPVRKGGIYDRARNAIARARQQGATTGGPTVRLGDPGQCLAKAAIPSSRSGGVYCCTKRTGHDGSHECKPLADEPPFLTWPNSPTGQGDWTEGA